VCAVTGDIFLLGGVCAVTAQKTGKRVECVCRGFAGLGGACCWRVCGRRVLLCGLAAVAAVAQYSVLFGVPDRPERVVSC
jgi:hypothetical protein